MQVSLCAMAEAKTTQPRRGSQGQQQCVWQRSSQTVRAGAATRDVLVCCLVCMWCSGAVRDTDRQCFGGLAPGRSSAACSFCSVAGVRRPRHDGPPAPRCQGTAPRDLDNAGDGEGNIVCRRSLYLPCTQCAYRTYRAPSKGTNGAQEFQAFPPPPALHRPGPVPI